MTTKFYTFATCDENEETFDFKLFRNQKTLMDYVENKTSSWINSDERRIMISSYNTKDIKDTEKIAYGVVFYDPNSSSVWGDVYSSYEKAKKKFLYYTGKKKITKTTFVVGDDPFLMTVVSLRKIQIL